MECIYTQPANWMDQLDCIKYGLHIATKFENGWLVRDYIAKDAWREADEEEQKQFDDMNLLDQ